MLLGRPAPIVLEYFNIKLVNDQEIILTPSCASSMDEEYSMPKEPDSQSARSFSESFSVAENCTGTSWAFSVHVYVYLHCGFVTFCIAIDIVGL